MFEANFYLDLVNAEYGTNLTPAITVASLPQTSERILVRIRKYLRGNAMKGASFNHYRPARRLADHIASLEGQIAECTLGRFEQAFKVLNGLL